MLIGNYQFSPSLAPSLVVLALFPILIGLGMWQLERAEEKRGIEESVQQAQFKESLQLSTAKEGEILAEVYRPASALGRYDSQHQFLYDNRTHNGRPGYHVLTPFILKGGQKAVLVNRGWIPFNGRRDNIQPIDVINTELTLKGVIKSPSKSIVLKDEEVVSGYPQTIQFIALGDMGSKLGYTFLPIVIELDKSANEGYVREWQPFYGSIAKHNGYAMQWFAMAVVLLILFLKLSTTKQNSKNNYLA
ncbi:MAG: SURF1 family protein [Thiotrichaceae bacterium]